jgi:hypothetical protein
MSEHTNETNETLFKILNQLTNDIIRTFPEYNESNLYEGLIDILNEKYDTNTSKIVVEHCKTVYPERFFDIIYENEEIFNDENVSTEFLPGIDFKLLWNQNISDKTKNIIWKYLQLIIRAIMKYIDTHESFGETANLFEAIDENVLKEKLEETFSNIEETFKNTNFDISNIGVDFSGNQFDNSSNNLPSSDDIHNHMKNMLSGKLGKLASEIAEETAQDLDIELDEKSNMSDVFKKLFKNPGKLMSLVKTIGKKVEDKMKSGEISKSELMEDAKNMVDNMKNMPGMENIQSMLSKMNMGGNKGKLNMNNLKSHLEQNIKISKQKERMMQKLNENKQESFVYSTGEKPQRTIISSKAIKQNKRKNKKNKKNKKHKN